mmetsp:Transcript_15430/g.43113  ORF Transcript_15430/g.43113 Transcript_15430/m.43113 type:complete len:270 (-) Transcript_15430:454-1263(-)|eukprot:scaffold72915_cov27-Tisochrysis_lutea.AAC.1
MPLILPALLSAAALSREKKKVEPNATPQLETVLISLLVVVVLSVLIGSYLSSATTVSLPSSESFSLLARSRRSVFPKHYSGESVPRHAVERALEDANWAPTHGKTEPWRFVVFEGTEAIQKLITLKREGIEAMTTGAEKVAALEKAAKKEKELMRCSHIIAICCKRLENSKGVLMPEWEEVAATACAVHNLHFSIHASGYAGYWSSGGVGGGWADAPAVRAFLGMDGECQGAKDKVLGFFHVGVVPKERVALYHARRGPIAVKTQWVKA